MLKKASLSMTTEELPKVYCGVDCFGRGTYLGGGFSSGEAAAVASQHRHSTALFAPGWTVEKCGHFRHADDVMWRGVPWTQEFFDMRVVVGDFETDGLEVVTGPAWAWRRGSTKIVPKFDLDEKLHISGRLLRIYVEFRVRGTGPNFADPFSVKVNIDAPQCTFLVGAPEQRIRDVATERVRVIVFESVLVVTKPGTEVTVTVEDGGRDAENWGGFFGARLGRVSLEAAFTGQSCRQGLLQPRAETIPLIPSVPFSSFICVGHGDKMVVDGTTLRDEPWSNMAFQSLLPSRQWSGPCFSEFSFAKSFSFGSSLRLVSCSASVRAPLYRLPRSSSALVVQMVVCGSPVRVFLADKELNAVSKKLPYSAEWQFLEFEGVVCDVDDSVLSVSTEGEAFVGAVSIYERPVKPKAKHVRVSSAFQGHGLWRHLVSWELEHSHYCSAVDIMRGSEVLARLLPEQTSWLEENSTSSVAEYRIVARGCDFNRLIK
jgi:hypothetical protein